MRSVTFVQDHCYEGGGVAPEKRSFRRRQTYELPEPSAAHYVRQGRAVWAEGAGAVKAHQVRTKPAPKTGVNAASRPLAASGAKRVGDAERQPHDSEHPRG